MLTVKKCCVVLTLLGITAWPVLADEPVRRIEQTVFAGEVHTLEMDLGVGNITIEGTDGRDVEVEVELSCGREDADKCLRRAERIELVPRRNKGRLKLRLKGTPRGRAGGIAAEMYLRIPRRLGIEVDLQSGNLLVSGLESHMEIDVGAGDVDLKGRQASIAKVNASVTVGRADLWMSDGRIEGTGFPRSLKWQGNGTAEWEVDIGSGNASIHLQ